ncbi:MAG: prolipoprotein diacylglyceryl transferase [Bdellovibrionaceae bacterium]|nr:prolipoprotein diacylglyceryl transferase [Pseudobdellovibrionaceae bacterium]|tara:strand:+ start:7017 stop:8072 length:1056 start_codon:yes stop_codon:yes gene_type:complete
MSYVHTLDPFLVEIYHGFGIRWYGLAYLAGFVLGYLLVYRLAQKKVTPMLPEQVGDFATWMAIGTLLGGRLGYVFFYSPDLLTSINSHFPYWGVLRVNEGGMASHGGIMGIMVAAFIYCRRHNIPFLHSLDMVVFGGSLGIFFGRIANYINGELYGRQAPEGFFWIVKFPQEMFAWMRNGHEKLMGLGPAVQDLVPPVDPAVWRGWVSNMNVDMGAYNAVSRTVDQLILATQNGNEKVIQALSLVLTPRYPSQLFQAVLEGLLVFFALVWVWRKPQKMGVVSGWFGALYCVARIIGEQFRLPDAHIGYQLFGLTRGQWLSIAMLVVAVGYLVYAYRRTGPKIGGWASHTEL